jgi:hypothetical protein
MSLTPSLKRAVVDLARAQAFSELPVHSLSVVRREPCRRGPRCCTALRTTEHSLVLPQRALVAVAVACAFAARPAAIRTVAVLWPTRTTQARKRTGAGAAVTQRHMNIPLPSSMVPRPT